MNGESFEERTSFRPQLIYAQNYVVDLAGVSREALRKDRPATAFDRLPGNGGSSVNSTFEM
jgi:hypothetical protein